VVRVNRPGSQTELDIQVLEIIISTDALGVTIKLKPVFTFVNLGDGELACRLSGELNQGLIRLSSIL